LTSSIISPSTKRLLDQYAGTYSNFKVVTYEPISQTGMIKANEAGFGVKAVPSYHFDKAKTIVAVGCDFLGAWVSPIEFAGQYAKNRMPRMGAMSRHYQFESRVSQTGANADYRFSVKPSQEKLVVAALYAGIVGGGNVSGLGGKVAAAIGKAVADLKKDAGQSLVVSGSNDPGVQTMVNAINSQLGNYSSTIDLSKPYNTLQGDDTAVAALQADMSSGRVGVLLVHKVNPAYDLPGFDTSKVGTVVSMSDRADETAAVANYCAPVSHYLESWGDAEPKAGEFSLIQPTISPLFNTRSLLQSLMNWVGAGGTDYDYIKKFWKNNITGNWEKTLQDGVISAGASGGGDSIPPVGTVFTGNASSAFSAATSGAGGGVELILYEKPTMGDGRYANNPFLQETPDPISKVCWDNCAIVSKKLADRKGWYEGEQNDGNTVLSISANGHSVEVPITIQPGLQDDTIALAMGYGRTKPGNDYCTVGANAYPFRKMVNGTYSNVLSNVDVKEVRRGYVIAQTQTHETIDDRREIISEASYKEWTQNKFAGNKSGMKARDPHYWDHHWVSIYSSDRDKELKQGHHWGMSIDMNTCVGCAACVTACNIENNVPVVGKDLVADAKEMHWMRIDRYYKFDAETDPDMEHPTVSFQPMLCQHCDNAPCENVCPVNASNHSSEGLNQMAYNRCIGTRYCANNCPYKVRRFNWFDFQGADSFYKRGITSNDQKVLADDLMRMVLNPDVTVRSRGVMEKCSFCVQRIQEGKLDAKKKGEKLRDGAVKTACQTACPTHAITFGDMNDTESEIRKANANERMYHLLEQIHVLPSVSYQTIIRNVDEQMTEPFEVEGPFEDKYGEGRGRGQGHHGDHGHGHGDGHGGGHGDGHGAGHGDGHGGGHESHGKGHHDDHGKGNHGDHSDDKGHH